ncbi:MAG: PilN domain-containing protein [Candidatus Omnitrophota bacterium]
MVEINLLPEEIKRKKIALSIPEIPLVPIAVLIVVILVLVQVLMVGLGSLSKKQQYTLGKEWDELKPQSEELDRIKSNISILTKKTEAIEELLKIRLNWAGILNELSDSLTENIWLQELSYGAGGARSPALLSKRSLKISGFASGRGGQATAFVTHFVKALRNNSDFSKYFDEIEHGPIREVTVKGEQVMSFTINCAFKEGGEATR